MTRRQRKAARFALAARTRNESLHFVRTCDGVARMKNVWLAKQLALELVEVAALRVATAMQQAPQGR